MKKRFFALFLLFFFLSLLTLFILNNKKINKDRNNLVNNEHSLPVSNNTLSYYRNTSINPELQNNIPFMVIVENSENARPQSGLASADILYETLAEGGITRFFALYQQEYPKIIGPVRSVRPYFIDIAREYNVPFIHCGGSEEALNEISSDSSLMSLNEIQQGSYFWRDKSKVSPHNLYTSSDNILKYIDDNNLKFNYRKDLNFNTNYYSKISNSLSEASINYNSSYKTSYKYKDGLFTKYINNKKQTDALNNKELTFTNIIIQQTSIDTIDSKLHLNIKLIGKGNGYILSKGKYIKVTWERTSVNSKTTFYDSNNNEVPLSSGKTMWNIVDNSTKININ